MVVLRWACRSVGACLLGVTLVAPLSGAPADAHRHAAKIPTLVVAWNISDTISLDPGHAFQITNEPVDHEAYDTLVRVEGGDVGHIRPSLATSWKITRDNTVFT